MEIVIGDMFLSRRGYMKIMVSSLRRPIRKEKLVISRLFLGKPSAEGAFGAKERIEQHLMNLNFSAAEKIAKNENIGIAEVVKKVFGNLLEIEWYDEAVIVAARYLELKTAGRIIGIVFEERNSLFYNGVAKKLLGEIELMKELDKRLERCKIITNKN